MGSVAAPIILREDYSPFVKSHSACSTSYPPAIQDLLDELFATGSELSTYFLPGEIEEQAIIKAEKHLHNACDGATILR